MWLDFEASEREIAYWKKLAELRRQRAASVDNEILQWSAPYFLSVAVSFNSDRMPLPPLKTPSPPANASSSH
jgi:hypothetical protein